MEIFSTIASPVFSELVLNLRDEQIAHLPSQLAPFEALRMANEIRPFKLVFFLVATDSSLGEARRKLARTIDLVTVKRLLNFLDSPPTIR